MTLKVNMLHTGCHSYELSQKIKGTFLEIYTFVKLCLSNLEQLVLVDTIRRTSHMVQEDPMIEEVKEDGTGGELRRKGEI